MLGWAGCGFHKKSIGTRYAKLRFCNRWDLRVRHCILVRPGRKTSTQYFFLFGWAQCGFHKKREVTGCVEVVFLDSVGSAGHVVLLVRPGCEMSTHHFSCSGGTVQIPQIAHCDTLCKTCGSASGGICGSRSAFWFIHGTKCPRNIFPAREGPVQVPQKVHRDTLHQNSVFASGGIYGSHSAFHCIWAMRL
jgi:hypothetical protein